MIIHEPGHTIQPHYPSKNIAKTATGGNSLEANETRRSGADASSVDSTRNLINLVSDDLGLRENLIQEIKGKLQNGDFFSPQAAAKTADAILDL